MSITSSFAVAKFADMYYAGYTLGIGAVVKGPNAIKNVIKMYLMSQKGDYGRNVTKGGPLFELLGKQVTETNQRKIEETITSAVASFSDIVVVGLVVTKVSRGWNISMTFTDTQNKFVDTINLSISEASPS